MSNSPVRALQATLRGCVLTGLLLAAVRAQTTTQPLPGLNDEQSARLLRHRAVIENTTDSPGTRQAQAEELLFTGWPAATDVLIELLETSNDPSTRVVICRAVAHVQITHPELVDGRLVDPLVRLLGESTPSVSSAASAALSAFRDGYVVCLLGEVARDPARPLEQRLAAIDALSPNTDQRPVIAQLIELLKVEEAELRERVFTALAPASRVDHGRSVEAWVAWWQKKSALDETAWLQNRVELFAQQTRGLQMRLDTLRRESESRYGALTRRLGDVLRLNYRLTAQESPKDELLVAWLRDPLLEFRRTAVELVREQIYEQKRPSEVVRAALREQYAEAAPDFRCEVLELVGALNDPADLEPILARLAVETDLSVRETILGVLGKLRNPGAIPVLIGEISNSSSPSTCVAKAAQSLATLARENGDPGQLHAAVGPLRTRLAAADAADLRLRGALLGAMAGIGSADCAAEFSAHLNEPQPELLLPAIRGVVAVQDREQMDRLRALLLHADPQVRREAIEAVGTLAEDESPLEALANHLNVATESNEAVRSAAWTAFCKVLKREPAEIRLKWVGRLKDLPNRQVEYLTALAEDFAQTSPKPTQLNEAREMLARLLREQERYAESVRHLQELYALLGAGGDPRAGEIGVLLLDSMLRSGQRSERIEQLLSDLAKHGDEVKVGVVRTITDYLHESVPASDDPGLATLAERLRRACHGRYGQPFDDHLDSVLHELTPPPTTEPADQT